jgi:hypothetical protein
MAGLNAEKDRSHRAVAGRLGKGAGAEAGKDEILKAETLKSESERRRRGRWTTAPKFLPVDFRLPVVSLVLAN